MTDAECAIVREEFESLKTAYIARMEKLRKDLDELHAAALQECYETAQREAGTRLRAILREHEASSDHTGSYFLGSGALERLDALADELAPESKPNVALRVVP